MEFRCLLFLRKVMRRQEKDIAAQEGNTKSKMFLEV
jgi:hypothetical protein